LARNLLGIYYLHDILGVVSGFTMSLLS
jgi:hypothetical protein